MWIFMVQIQLKLYITLYSASCIYIKFCGTKGAVIKWGTIRGLTLIFVAPKHSRIFGRPSSYRPATHSRYFVTTQGL